MPQHCTSLVAVYDDLRRRAKSALIRSIGLNTVVVVMEILQEVSTWHAKSVFNSLLALGRIAGKPGSSKRDFFMILSDFVCARKLAKPILLAVYFIVILTSVVACNTPPVPENEERADLAYCQDSRPSISDAFGSYLDASRSDNLLRTERQLVSLHHSVDCATPQELVESYETIIDQSNENGDDILIAPALLLLMDSGARIIDNRGYNWLAARRDEILRLLRNPNSHLSRIGFYRADGRYVRAMSLEQSRNLFEVLGNSDWLGPYCSLADLIWDQRVNGFICPLDDCPFLRSELDLSPYDAIPEEFQDICEELNDTFDTIASPGAAVQTCFDEYSESQEAAPAYLCVAEAWRNNRPVERLLNASPDIVVEVSEECQLGRDMTMREHRRSVLRSKKDQLEKELKLIEEEIDRYEKILKGEEDGDASEALTQLPKAEEDREEVEAELDDVEKELKDLEEEDDDSLLSCSEDDPWCTNACGARDPLLQQLHQCWAPAASRPIGESPDPTEPADPRVIEPLPDAVTSQSAFAKLTDCLSRALSTDPNSGETSCNTCLRCSDGESPTLNEQGLCTCSSGPGDLGPSGTTRCQQAIECSPEGECTCPDGSEIPVTEPGEPVDPRVLLTVDGEEPQCVEVWGGDSDSLTVP